MAEEVDDPMDTDECYVDLDGEKQPNPAVYRHVRRAATRTPASKRDIFVSRKNGMGSVLRRARAVLAKGQDSFVILHGMGAALGLAVAAARTLADEDSTCTLGPRTGTVEVVDDYEPLPGFEELDPISRVRAVSCIHITIRKVRPLVTAAITNRELHTNSPGHGKHGAPSGKNPYQQQKKRQKKAKAGSS